MSTLEWLSIAALVVLTLSTGLLTAWVWSISRRPDARDFRIAALEHEVDDLRVRTRKLTGRVGRQKQLDEADQEAADPSSPTAMRPGESPIEWKRRVRQLVAQGKVKHEV